VKVEGNHCIRMTREHSCLLHSCLYNCIRCCIPQRNQITELQLNVEKYILLNMLFKAKSKISDDLPSYVGVEQCCVIQRGENMCIQNLNENNIKINIKVKES